MSYQTLKHGLPPRRCSRPHRRGSVLISYALIVVALTAIASLAVDYGHVQVVKTQLEIAADAASRAGADQLAAGSSATQIAAASSYAISTAAANISDQTPVLLLPADVILGNYDVTQTPNFSASRTPYNAVQVTVRRQAVDGNPVALLFAPIIGMPTCDVTATSVAAVSPPESPYGLAGINSVTFGSIGVLAQIKGDVASDGDISIGNPLGVAVSVSGNARSFNGYISKGSAATIAGSTTPLSAALNYPDVQVPSANNNASIASYLDTQSNFIAVGYASIPSGTYVVNNLNLLADVQMDLKGPVTFYVTGAFNVAASITLLGSTNTTATNFTVYVASGGTVNFLAPILVPMAMIVYAPQSDITIAVGITSFTGELIGKTLNIDLPLLGTFTEVKPAVVPQAVSFVP